MIEVKEASASDAARMSEILSNILESWKSQRPRSAQHVLEYYIEHTDRIKCSVATDKAGRVWGFQSLKIVNEDNVYDLPAGWGIIGTYVDADAGRKGVGKALFASSREAAIAAGLSKIDATIGDRNAPALAYYDAMGFETYEKKSGAIRKVLTIG